MNSFVLLANYWFLTPKTQVFSMLVHLYHNPMASTCQSQKLFFTTTKFSPEHWENDFYKVLFLFFFKTPPAPLGKRGLPVLMDYNKVILKFVPTQWDNGFYDVHFPLFYSTPTPHPLPKTWTTQFSWITTNKFKKLHKTSELIGFMSSLFHLFT